MRRATWGIAGQRAQEELIDGQEEALDAPAAAWATGHGEDERHPEVRADLFEVLGSEVAAVVGIEGLGNPTDMPARVAFAPDGFPHREGRLKRRGCLHAEPIRGDGAAV